MLRWTCQTPLIERYERVANRSLWCNQVQWHTLEIKTFCATPTHRHTFRRYYPATAIPPPGWTRLRWRCTKTVNRDFLLVQPTTEAMVHKNFFFFFSVRPAPRPWSWGSLQKGRATSHWCREPSDPFVRPCHTKENISLDFRDLRTAYVPSAKEDDDHDERDDLAKFRHF